MMWVVYLISCGTGTYVGSTNNPTRRLRQHNREIVGGARATAKGAPNWKFVCILSGFETRSVVCRWEAIIKKRARGLTARQSAMHLVHCGECPIKHNRSVIYEVPGNLVITDYVL